MYSNMGKVDRLLRLIVGAALLFLPFSVFDSYFGSGVIYLAALLIGGILVVTSLFGICPLYSLLGVSTKRES